ncbi:MAG: hypothetical protein QM711_12880 [Micropruina sp.]
MLAGSCSEATRGQIAAAIERGHACLQGRSVGDRSGRFPPSRPSTGRLPCKDAIPLIYSSADPDEVRAAQDKLGRDRAGELVEHFLADVAASLRARGFTPLPRGRR